MLENWLMSLPKWFLVFGALTLGILVMFVVQPPATVCDAQVEQFKETQVPHLFLLKKKKYDTTIKWESHIEMCKQGNSPGACLELFNGMRKLLRDLNAVSNQCLQDVGGLVPVKKSIWETMTLMLKIAWGEKPPASQYEKMAWFDLSHMEIFCKLQKKSVEIYSKEQWDSYREKTMAELPGFAQIGRNGVWPLSLFSFSCDQLSNIN